MQEKDIPLNQLVVANREMLQATGILEVESFNENEVLCVSKLGPLIVKGEELHITKLNLESSQLVVEGKINGVQYVENKKAKLKNKSKGIMDRLFK